MKLNTHERTPRPKSSKLLTGLFVLCGVLMYGILGLGSFVCFYYAQSIIGGIFVILIPTLLTVIILINIRDIENAYIEIIDNEIYVFDYYCGIRKEKRFSFSDITSAEIYPGYSHKVKGNRISIAGMRYIIFKNGKKYLFKIAYFPETAEVFKQYINNTAE